MNDGVPGFPGPDWLYRSVRKLRGIQTSTHQERVAREASAPREVLMLKGRGNMTGMVLIIFGLVFANGPMAGRAAAQGTAQQQMACQSDAFRLCGQYIPNADSVKACMVKQIRNLSPDCRSEFNEGKTATKKVNRAPLPTPLPIATPISTSASAFRTRTCSRALPIAIFLIWQSIGGARLGSRCAGVSEPCARLKSAGAPRISS